MSKRVIWILAGVMAIASIGLIVVQTYWIKNAVNVKEQQFNQLVNKSITKIVDKIENRKTAYNLIKEINPFRFDSIPGKVELSIHYDSISYYTKDGRIGFYYEHNNSVYLRNRDTLRSKPVIVTYSGDSSKIKTQTIQPSEIAESNEKHKLREKDELSFRKQEQNIQSLEDMMKEILEINISVQENIDIPTLNVIISDEFQDKGIELGYEFAVKNHKNEYILNSPDFTNIDGDMIYKSKLFPGGVFAQPSYLNIYFPKKQNYIFMSLGIMVFSSIFLTLIIILSFFFTIYIIFKQKKLSEIKNDFINNMTHELKKPISTISL